MEQRFRNIPFPNPEKPSSVPEVGSEDIQSHCLYHDFKQDDGLYSAALEHRPSDPEVMVPAHSVRGHSFPPEQGRKLERLAEEETTDEVAPRGPAHSLRRHLRRYWKLMVLCLILLIFGVSIGLGIGLGRHKNRPNAMDGSGVVALDLHDGTPRITIYFQHVSGQIRQAQYKDGIWSGYDLHALHLEKHILISRSGNSADAVLANNPRARSPLMAVSYVHGDELNVCSHLYRWRFPSMSDKSS